MSLVDLALSVDEELERGELVHAFGGALALAYLTEPRGTADVDVNVFIPVEPSAGPDAEAAAGRARAQVPLT